MTEKFYNRIIDRINSEIDTLKSLDQKSKSYNAANIYANMIEIGRCGTIKNIIEEEYNRLNKR